MALRKEQKSLRKWSEQKWRTSSGEPSEGEKRYLPDKAWDALSPQEKAATNRAKKEGDKKGKQFVAQPEKIAKKTRKYRLSEDMFRVILANQGDDTAEHTIEADDEDQAISKTIDSFNVDVENIKDLRRVDEMDKINEQEDVQAAEQDTLKAQENAEAAKNKLQAARIDTQINRAKEALEKMKSNAEKKIEDLQTKKARIMGAENPEESGVMNEAVKKLYRFVGPIKNKSLLQEKIQLLNEKLTRPHKGEKKQEFISRFMGTELAKKEFPDNKQRVAVAYSQWERGSLREDNLNEGFMDTVNKIMTFAKSEFNKIARKPSKARPLETPEEISKRISNRTPEERKHKQEIWKKERLVEGELNRFVMQKIKDFLAGKVDKKEIVDIVSLSTVIFQIILVDNLTHDYNFDSESKTYEEKYLMGDVLEYMKAGDFGPAKAIIKRKAAEIYPDARSFLWWNRVYSEVRSKLDNAVGSVYQAAEFDEKSRLEDEEIQRKYNEGKRVEKESVREENLSELFYLVSYKKDGALIKSQVEANDKKAAAEKAKEKFGISEEDIIKIYDMTRIPVAESQSLLSKYGVEGYNKPKRTPSHPTKSHLVVAKKGDKIKVVRFGAQGAKGSPKKEGESKDYANRRRNWIKRHKAQNPGGFKDKFSALYWANKVKW